MMGFSAAHNATMVTPRYVLFIFLLICLIGSSSTARILMLHIQVPSQMSTTQAIGAELSRRGGHDVYSALSNKFLDASGAKMPQGVKLLTYHLPDMGAVYVYNTREASLAFYEEITGSLWEEHTAISQAEYNHCSSMMEDKEFLSEVSELQFDFAIVELQTESPCLTILPAWLNIPFAVSSTFLEADMFRLPLLPSFNVNFFEMRLSQKMNFLERVQNVYTFIMYSMYLPHLGIKEDHLLQTYGHAAYKDLSWQQVVRKAEIVIHPRNHLLDWPKALMPHVVSIPGIVKQSKPLPDPLQSIMDRSPHGVVVMTFGSKLGWIPQNMVTKFLTAFKSIEQTVIWRLETELDAETVPSNVHVLRWLPQTDLLAHNNTRLFITHAGYGGLMESVTHGVPMVAFPHYCDQFRNAKVMEEQGLGLGMDIRDFTAEELLVNINEVLTNPMYRKNACHLAAILADQPMTSLETAGHWIEHVIKFGGGHLKSHALDMPWYEYYMIDIMCVLFGVLFLLGVIQVSLISRVVNRRWPNQSQTSCATSTST